MFMIDLEPPLRNIYIIPPPLSFSFFNYVTNRIIRLTIAIAFLIFSSLAAFSIGQLVENLHKKSKIRSQQI